MGFQELKSKLSGENNELSIEVNEDSILEWIAMDNETKKLLINEAKEQGGAMRQSILEIHQLAGYVLQEEVDETALDSIKKGFGKLVTGAKEKMTSAGEYVGGKVKGAGEAMTANPKTTAGVAAGAPALAAGLGAVALAKKMRASKKAG
jgi:hypothetical protein